MFTIFVIIIIFFRIYLMFYIDARPSLRLGVDVIDPCRDLPFLIRRLDQSFRRQKERDQPARPARLWTIREALRKREKMATTARSGLAIISSLGFIGPSPGLDIGFPGPRAAKSSSNPCLKALDAGSQPSCWISLEWEDGG